MQDNYWGRVTMTEGMIKGIRGGKRGKQEEKAHLLCSVRVVPGNKQKSKYSIQSEEKLKSEKDQSQ